MKRRARHRDAAVRSNLAGAKVRGETSEVERRLHDADRNPRTTVGMSALRPAVIAFVRSAGAPLRQRAAKLSASRSVSGFQVTAMVWLLNCLFLDAFHVAVGVVVTTTNTIGSLAHSGGKPGMVQVAVALIETTDDPSPQPSPDRRGDAPAERPRSRRR